MNSEHTELRFFRKKMPGIPVGPCSRFPSLRNTTPPPFLASGVGEEDGLFLNYGNIADLLPYTMFDEYDFGRKQELEFDAAVLENRYLRVEFLLSVGGKIQGIYDKIGKRELLTDNPEFKPGNLAIRNAWVAGGVEWNCGRFGHDPDTCVTRFSAELQDPEYGPVLRVYDYNRDRKTPWQMDFFLPPDSRFLFARGRIYNPNEFEVPMYWWSNMALPLHPGSRVVVPAPDTYSHRMENGRSVLVRLPMPDGEGFEQSYPENFPMARDHFYHIPEDARKYEAIFAPDGKGFLHLSTRRMQGRKLFVWGSTAGSAHWQRNLLADAVQNYCELQGGIARHQQESLPMPPRTSWEWLEAYGAVDASPEKIFGTWQDAVRTVTAHADELLPEQELDRILKETHERIAMQPGLLRTAGPGDAALEELRSGKKLQPQLDFGQPGADQAEWAKLLQEHVLDDLPPRSFEVDPAWLPLLKTAPECWKKNYFLSLQYFRKEDGERALTYAEKALALDRNAWTLQLAANAALTFAGPDKVVEALSMMQEAALKPEADGYLIKETMKLLILKARYSEALALYPRFSEKDRNRPMMRFLHAAALAYTGKIAEAEAILFENGGLDLPDAREGELHITKLYQYILNTKGIPPEKQEIPFKFDYRVG